MPLRWYTPPQVELQQLQGALQEALRRLEQQQQQQTLGGSSTGAAAGGGSGAGGEQQRDVVQVRGFGVGMDTLRCL